MHSAAQFQSQPSAAGLRLFQIDAQPHRQLVGGNATWRKLLMQVDVVAPHVQVAAVEGEPGSGKETLARYLHSRSAFARSSFQRCEAREWLATDTDPGKLQGFLYLDRVDQLAAPGQGLLLGVLKALQDRSPGRAVVVASSHAPLRHMAAQGLLLPDLAYRLTAVRFAVPALRQRREDIAPLTQALLGRLGARYNQRPVSLEPGALARLLQHSWPGNIRELACVLEAALLDASNGVIRAENLPISAEKARSVDPQPGPSTEHLELDAVIRVHVRHVLDLNRGNKLRASRQLGISRSTLYRILSNEEILTQ